MTNVYGLLNYIFYIEPCTSIMHCRHAKGPAVLLTFQCRKIMIPFNSADTVYY